VKWSFRVAGEDLGRDDRIASDRVGAPLRQPGGDVVASHHDQDGVQATIAGQHVLEHEIQTLRRDAGEADIPDMDV